MKPMPVITDVLAQNGVARIILARQSSRGSTATLIAAAAKPAGHMNIGQVSPTRKVSDFPGNRRTGTMTAVESRIATGSRAR